MMRKLNHLEIYTKITVGVNRLRHQAFFVIFTVYKASMLPYHRTFWRQNCQFCDPFIVFSLLLRRWFISTFISMAIYFCVFGFYNDEVVPIDRCNPIGVSPFTCSDCFRNASESLIQSYMFVKRPISSTQRLKSTTVPHKCCWIIFHSAYQG